MSYRLRQWIGYLVMVIGVGVLSAPFLQGTYQGWEQQKVVNEFYSMERTPVQTQPVTVPTQAPTLPPETEPAAEPAETQPELTEPPAEAPSEVTPEQQFYQDALAYNDYMARGGQEGIRTLTDFEYFALDARNYGFSQNIVGTIRIPRMEIELGLYLGANTGNMALGAAIFGYTSLPLGAPNENTAIAGHRGWAGTPMFRNIQMLQMDDPIYVTTPWAELVYRVSSIEIVTPKDTGWCRIVPGKTMLSLMTCHPYGQNYQRYIVHAELTDEEKPEEEEILRQVEDTFDPSPKTVIMVAEDGTRETASVDSTAITPDGSEYGAVMSNVVITAEDSMRPVAYTMAAIVALLGIWLTVQTVKDSRAEKEKKHEPE